MSTSIPSSHGADAASHTASRDAASVHSDATQRSIFATTHWSVVLTAGRTDTTRAHAALEKLCRIYWYPLYAYVRRRGYSTEDAQDLTQEFFAPFFLRGRSRPRALSFIYSHRHEPFSRR